MLLSNVAAQRHAELQQYDPNKDIPSDVENDSTTPHFDLFYEEGGSNAILSMTKFDPTQFQEIWGNIEEFVNSKYNVSRDKKSPISARDSFLMMLVVLKHGGFSDFLAEIFDLKGPAFGAHISKLVMTIVDALYESCVERVARKYTMVRLISKGKLFTNSRYARYATDVTLQQSYRPSGSIQEGRKYLSDTHKLDGYKRRNLCFAKWNCYWLHKTLPRFSA